MKPYQQRVVEDRIVLQTRIDALQPFVHGSVVRSLPAEEQQRLERQLRIMIELEAVLAERIVFFIEGEA